MFSYKNYLLNMAKPDLLKPYREKRNFSVHPNRAVLTSAPIPGGVVLCRSKHWASRLHYDFRLELDGTMKSWAFKGPSYDPADKRMAAHVEGSMASLAEMERELTVEPYPCRAGSRPAARPQGRTQAHNDRQQD